MKTLIILFTFLLAICSSVKVHAVQTVTTTNTGISILGDKSLSENKKPKKRKKKRTTKKKSGVNLIKLFGTLFFISGGLALAGLVTMILGFLALATSGEEAGILAFYIGYIVMLAFGSLTTLLGILWLVFYLVENA